MLRLVLAIVTLAWLGGAAGAQGVIQLPQCVVPPQAPGVPVVSAAATNTMVIKAAPGCLFSLYLTVGGAGAAGYLLVFNSATVPADGAVTPVECVFIAAAPSTAAPVYAPQPPIAFTVGISAAYSSTGCYTKTTPGTPVGFFHALIQ